MQNEAITDPFSEIRRTFLTDFANLPEPHTASDVSAVWSKHFHSLEGARGIFAVIDGPVHDIPGNLTFSDKAHLRCWINGERFFLIQNQGSSKPFNYGSPIICDTNFVSYCGAFAAGKDLGPNARAFREVVTNLLPIAQSTNAWPYLVENMENQDKEKVLASLKGYAKFKLCTPDAFAKSGRFVVDEQYAHTIAEGTFASMSGPAFNEIRDWVKERFLWARVVLLRAATMVMKEPKGKAENLFYNLLKFLHEKLA